MTSLKWRMAEWLANVIPQRVVVMVLFRVLKEFGFNKDMTLKNAGLRYKRYVD